MPRLQQSLPWDAVPRTLESSWMGARDSDSSAFITRSKLPSARLPRNTKAALFKGIWCFLILFISSSASQTYCSSNFRTQHHLYPNSCYHSPPSHIQRSCLFIMIIGLLRIKFKLLIKASKVLYTLASSYYSIVH